MRLRHVGASRRAAEGDRARGRDVRRQAVLEAGRLGRESEGMEVRRQGCDAGRTHGGAGERQSDRGKVESEREGQRGEPARDAVRDPVPRGHDADSSRKRHVLERRLFARHDECGRRLQVQGRMTAYTRQHHRLQVSGEQSDPRRF